MPGVDCGKTASYFHMLLSNSSLLTLLFSLASIQIVAQQLPDNPDPNKCYVRTVTPDIYDTYEEEFFTYTKEEAEQYPHQKRRLKLIPKRSRWVSVPYEDCVSDDPNDCQVLVYRTFDALYATIYEPENQKLGNPFWKTLEFEELVESGGVSAYEEVDCELTTYNYLPVWFQGRECPTRPAI